MEGSVYGFSISNVDNYSNQALEVVFTPDSSVNFYEYRRILNGTPDEYVTVTSREATTIFLDKSGTYQIEVRTYDNYNAISEYKSGYYKLDLESPQIFASETFEIKKGSSFNPLTGVTAKDNIDGDLSDLVTTNIKSLNLNEVGTHKLTFTVTDSAGNQGFYNSYIKVARPTFDYILVMQLTVLLAFILIIRSFLNYQKSFKLASRIGRFGVEPINDDYISVFDKISNIYRDFIKKIGTLLSKSHYFSKYSKKYEKYIRTADNMHETGIEFIANKFIIAIFFVITVVFAKALINNPIKSYELILPFTLGFFIPDAIYIYKYKLYREKIENDLLQAIIVMNNVFKAGGSITQAIELVSLELEGPVAEEFKKMYLELSFGLGIDIIFKRLDERINLEEVSYLTASLTILNKSGGNIINVFSSIEKSLFNKKKLKLELKSLTGSSKVIFMALLIVPIFFGLFINLINPGYFTPLFASPLGLFIVALIIIIYVTYFFVARALMKVRM